MTDTAFFDTNLFVYLYDARVPQKREIAQDLFKRYFGIRKGAMSTQVLQEFFVAVTRKTGLLTVAEAAAAVADFSALDNLVIVQPHHILEAIRLHLKLRISFWDGLILAAAKAASASLLYSEDLSPGRVYEGVRVENPFLVH